MLSDARRGCLPAILFHLAFWHMDLGYFGRGLFGSWPQSDAGIVLWSLSICAYDWQTSEKLTRLLLAQPDEAAAARRIGDDALAARHALTQEIDAASTAAVAEFGRDDFVAGLDEHAGYCAVSTGELLNGAKSLNG